MDPQAFEAMARQELARVPPRFARRVRNVAILIEDAPSPEVCLAEGLGEGETLLGLYHGVPANERGIGYSGILPDTITLYRLPLLEEADTLLREKRSRDIESAARLALRETLWHELGHHFGLSEGAVEAREVAGTNKFPRGTDRFGYAQRTVRTSWRAARGGIMGRAFRSLRLSGEGRVISLTIRMAKTLAIISGIVFVLVGLLGFVDNPLVGMDAFFEADMAHNLVHLVIGLTLLAVAFLATAQSALWLKIIGVVYLIVAVLGFFLTSGGMLLGIMAVNDADHWLHVVLGVALLAAGYLANGETSATSAAPPTPPAGAM